MGIFTKLKKKNEEVSWKEQKDKLERGEIDIQTFVDTLKNTKVFYSTPAGNDKSGNPQLYLLSDNNSDVSFFPAFLSSEHCTNWYNSVGRNGFLILEGDLGSMLKTLDSNEMLSKLGVLIELNTEEQVIIPPNVRAFNIK